MINPEDRHCFYIEWLDCAGFAQNSWRDLEEIETLVPVKVQTVGWLVKEDDTSVVLVSSISDENGIAFGEVVILKSTITHMGALT